MRLRPGRSHRHPGPPVGTAVQQPVADPPDRGRDASSGGAIRPEIQALRAIAVGSVLLYHLWPGRLTGGFVGVDVFFVISGFLIGGHLLHEMETTGRLRLGRFWSRRAARLLPASLATLLAVCAATLTLVPLSRRESVLGEVIGSALYVQNWVLADKSVDYLASAEAPSPVQHYWTLSVEEQLYVALPLLLVLVALLCRVTGLGRRRVAFAAIVVVTLASATYSWYLTQASPGVAYFSTGTRAWEFLLGAVLALSAGASSRLLRAAMGWAGLVAIATACLLFDGSTPFPGLSALVPVGGALALIAAGDAGPLAVVARWRPVTWVGDVSYALYLWHWPLIVFVPIVTEHPLTSAEKLAIGAASVLLAWASTRAEHVVRFSPRLLGGRRPLVVGAALATASLVVVGSAVVIDRAAGRGIAEQQARADTLAETTDVRCLGAQVALDGRPAGCPDLGDALVPAPSAVALDDGNKAECWSGGPEADLNICRAPGSRSGGMRVLAIGDSHNNMYVGAWEQLAVDRGWDVDIAGRAACAWTARDAVDTADPQRARDCTAWKAEVADYLSSRPAYDLIITTDMQSGPQPVRLDGETAIEAGRRAHADVWAEQTARGTLVIAVRDAPLARPDVVECVEREGAQATTACALERSAAIIGPEALKAAAATTPGAALVDVRDTICRRGTCRPVIGNVVVYYDRTHLTATFVRTLVPTLDERLTVAIEEARASLAAVSSP